ncbi:biliverdin-producing heme oxygenase [Sphingomicrobium nitratireducens]|uniref:biliverdin-producing heme oxygenase n=1 Tax=Sphingomicrobium nitratireducens TaxID=2964666 RepID=UPI00223F6983|nr:biliverdin-producing heme oxygenase [Sphingomicrobium nitratireducens]
MKAATQPLHDRLDAHFSGYDLGDEAQYRAFLLAHAAAFLPIEQALDEAGASRLWPEWTAMRRSEALVADLAELGADVPPAMAVPTFASDAEIAGATYVLEGSRLGGKLLDRTVGTHLPRRFLSHRSPLAWRDFVAQLERFMPSSVERTRAATAAASVFGCFLDAAD